MRWTFVIPVSTCPSRSVARNDNSFVPRVLKGHGFSRAVTCAWRVGLRPLKKLALRLNTEVPHWLKHFHTWCIGWSTASPGLFTFSLAKKQRMLYKGHRHWVFEEPRTPLESIRQ